MEPLRRKVLQSPVYHPDFPGNILYRLSLMILRWWTSTKCAIKLVDRLFRMDAMRRITGNARNLRMTAGEGGLIRNCGIADANGFITAPYKEADRINAEWPRQHNKSSKGYPKFTVREGDLLRIVDPAGDLIALTGCHQGRRTNPERAQNILSITLPATQFAAQKNSPQ